MYLSDDLLQYVLNLYLEYDQLEILDQCFNFKFDKNIHIRREKHKKIIKTYIDNQLRKKESWYSNGYKKFEKNYKNLKYEGIQYKWYNNGNKRSETNYKNGIQEGIDNCWFY